MNSEHTLCIICFAFICTVVIGVSWLMWSGIGVHYNELPTIIMGIFATILLFCIVLSLMKNFFKKESQTSIVGIAFKDPVIPSDMLPTSPKAPQLKLLPLPTAISTFYKTLEPSRKFIWKINMEPSSIEKMIYGEADYACDDFMSLARNGDFLLYGNKYTKDGELTRIPHNQIPLKVDDTKNCLSNCHNKWNYDCSILLASSGDSLYVNVSVESADFGKYLEKYSIPQFV